MEGPGSTVLPSDIISKNGFDHGTQMTSIVANTDPNIKIVFVRIIGNTKTGARQTTSEITVAKALKWVYDNKTRFNIQAVAMSQANHAVVTTRTDYCPTSEMITPMVSLLKSSNVPVFFAVGNDRDYFKLSWPACINESISVGMTDQYDQIDNYSNFDKDRLDFYATGNLLTTSPGGIVKYAAGSSVSTQVAAATWTAIKYKSPSLSYDDTYNLITRTSKPVRGARGQFGKLINYQGAVNVG